MSPRQALQRLSDAVLGPEFDRALRRARRSGRHRFLFGWNRGLGDVGLGLTPFFARIRRAFDDSRIDVITRKDLEPVFCLAGVDDIHAVPGLARASTFEIEAQAQRLGLDLSRYEGVFGNPDLRRWGRSTRDIVPARLQWPQRFDSLEGRFAELDGFGPLVGVHVHSETAHFYRYTKDWPTQRWPLMFASVQAKVPARFVLLGAANEFDLPGPGIVDLRGRASLLEVLSLIRGRIDALVAPDSGILSLVYLLDVQKDLDVVSLWADPRQGVLKLGQASPNARLRHHPILGRDEDVGNITVDEVADRLVACLRSRAGRNET